jgi:hypothetical protein
MIEKQTIKSVCVKARRGENRLRGILRMISAKRPDTGATINEKIPDSVAFATAHVTGTHIRNPIMTA